MNKQTLIAAFDNYKAKLPNSGDVLFAEVRKFAYDRIYHLEREFRKMGSAKTADDYVQDAVIVVLENKEREFVGGGEGFCAWLYKVCENKDLEFLTSLKKQRKKQVPMFIKSQEGDEDDFDGENPDIYEEEDDAGYIQIPKSVQGLDLDICKEIIAGYGYKQAAFRLGITVNVIEGRMKRLKKRIAIEQAEKKEKQAAKDSLRNEWEKKRTCLGSV